MGLVDVVMGLVYNSIPTGFAVTLPDNLQSSKQDLQTQRQNRKV